MKDATPQQRILHLLPGGGGWLSKILGALLAIGIIVAAAALAAFFFGFFLVIAAIASVWLAWQRWRMRRRARSDGSVPPGDGSRSRSSGPKVIQGEYEVVEEYEEYRETRGRNSSTRDGTNRNETRRDRPQR